MDAAAEQRAFTHLTYVWIPGPPVYFVGIGWLPVPPWIPYYYYAADTVAASHMNAARGDVNNASVNISNAQLELVHSSCNK